jgi:hypothetical protein
MLIEENKHFTFFYSLKGNVRYHQQLTALRKAWLLKPEVFTEELFKMTFISEGMSDDWPEVVQFMRQSSERHKQVAFAQKATIFLDLNVDGIQMFKSGIRQAVPVLSRISAVVNDRGEFFIFSTTPVFLVGTYFGTEKPDCDELLEYVFDELMDYHPGRDASYQSPRVKSSSTPARLKDYLTAQPKAGASWPEQSEGVAETSLHLGLDRVVADAPARKELTGTVGHAGYWALPRCIQRGVPIVSILNNATVLPRCSELYQMFHLMKIMDQLQIRDILSCYS